MKELTIHVHEDAVEFVEEFVERIGGAVDVPKGKPALKKIGAEKSKPKPFDFFDTWKDIPLNTENYRNKLWRPIQEL